MTDEQLVAYLDSAQDRIAATARSEHVAMVEAVRVGTVAAHDGKFYQRWKRLMDKPKKGAALEGSALEQAVARVAGMFPDNVIRVSA